MLGSMKMATIAIASILVVSGLGLVLLSQESDGYRSTDFPERLMIFGNANNDDYLDEDDITTLEKIIAGELDAEDHPLADANQDGVIDQKDIDMVRKMIDREPMEIYYLNAHGDVKSVQYPVGDVAVVGTGIMGAVMSIGADEKVAARSFGATYDRTLIGDLYDVPIISDSLFRADVELVSNIDGITAILTQESTRYVQNADVFENAGIDVIRIAATDGLDTIGGILTLGYLLGFEEQANEYVRFCDEIISYINDRVGPDMMADDERVTSLSVVMINSVSGKDSAYFSATQIAGSINLADWDDTTQRFQEGDEWLLSYDPDFIIHARGIGYGDVDIQATWDQYGQYFTEMRAYKEGNYHILNGNPPVIVRIAYIASIFYPDIIGEDFGDIKHQEFLDKFSNADNLNVKEDVVSTINVHMLAA